jgi:hypothetical protein
MFVKPLVQSSNGAAQSDYEEFQRWRVRPLTHSETVRQRVILDAIVALIFGVTFSELADILLGCDLFPANHRESTVFNRSEFEKAKGLWRAEKEVNPELRHSVLTLVAFHDLERRFVESSGSLSAAIEGFLNNKGGLEWEIPQQLCLADYGLGHDDRAKEPQPVRSVLGPRYLDWQLAQTAGELRMECHLHARNLLGEAAYQQLLSGSSESQAANRADPPAKTPAAEPAGTPQNRQKRLFE